MTISPQSFQVIEGRYSHLKAALEMSSHTGFHAEFGVHSASTLNYLAVLRADVEWWGFDTFTGLPKDWVRSYDGTRRSAKGELAVSKLPRVEPNVQLVQGLFAEVLPDWNSNQLNSASFVHIDCDLFESCRDVLFLLNDRLVPGTVIVFDELRDWNEQGVYERWREGEWAALEEWTRRFGRQVKPLFRTDWLEGSVKVVL